MRCSLIISLLATACTAFGEPAIRTIDIGGRKLEMASYGQGQPVVVVEAGMGEPAVESGTWKKVIDEVSKTIRICVYDRAGLGQSDPVTNATRTAQDIANDLHALLLNAKVPPPYVLVGHSIGGFVVRLYASKFPGEVAGIVLVDSSHPDQWSNWLAALPPASPRESEPIKKVRQFLDSQMTSPASTPERWDISASAAQVRAVSSLGDKPLTVLSHSLTWQMAPDLPAEESHKLEHISQQLQLDLCRLSTNCAHKIAAKAGHYIQAEDPQLVIDAILQLVKQAKK